MKAYKVIVSKSYHNDLENIIYYISKNFDSPFTALALLDEIEKEVSSLSVMPYRYSLVLNPYLKSLGFRKFMVKNYIIFYKVNEENKTIMIHRILHKKPNWIDIL